MTPHHRSASCFVLLTHNFCLFVNNYKNLFAIEHAYMAY